MTGRVSEEGMRKAKRALSAFRSMQPILNAYARMLTGKPTIQVVEAAHDNGSTDGNKIYYRPPISLGEELAHQRWLCDKRDDEGLQTCPSCAQREEILVTIYHEIAHIWFKSFEEVNEDRKAEALRDTVRLHGSKYAAAVADVIRSAPWSVTRDYMGLAGLISPFLPKIINALEDARVNSELFRAMQGTRQMFDADTRKIFKGGVEQVDEHGNWVNKQWREYPLNAQVICGLFCKASGYSYAEWFHTEVVAALDDPELTTIVEKNTWLSSMGEVFGLSFPVLVRLRELGFCKLDTDPEVEEEEPPPPPPTPDPEPEPEEQEPEDGGEDQDEEPESGPSGEDGETDDEEQGEDDAEPKSGESDGTGTEEPEPEAAGGGGEDQQEERDEDPSGGESAGEGDPGDERDSTPSESETGESGDVDASAEGPSEDGSDPEGPSGSDGGDEGVSDSPGVDSGEDRGDDSGGDDGLAEDLHDSAEGGERDPEAAGEDDSPGSGREPQGPRGVDGPPSGEQGPESSADLDSASDGDDDLGESERLDAPGGDAPWEPSDGDTGGAGGEGSGDDGERDAVLDTGPFTTGTRVVEDESTEPDEPRPEMGTPEECEPLLIKLGDHEPPGEAHVHQADDDAETMRTAIVQGMWFETPSSNIMGVHHYDFPPELYDRRPHQFDDGELERLTGEGWYYGWTRTDPENYTFIGVDPEEGESFDPPEQVVASALLKARLAFSDNLRGRHINNLKSGKVNGRSLGKRAPVGDDRVMRKKLKPSKKSYFVLIGIDISYSTVGENISLAKKLAMAECEMLGRLGVKFAVYAHSASRLTEIESETGLSGMHMTVYRVKEPDEPWNDKTRHKLKSLGADTANLDGHQFEYYRRILDRRPETTKILHYYTDGAMPAENKDEELIVLQRELKTIKQKGYVVLGVGIRTDSPKQHGLETAELHEVGDITKVIAHLERELTRR